jgi:uncharacterized repeat protein (TIGR02543 family)
VDTAELKTPASAVKSVKFKPSAPSAGAKTYNSVTMSWTAVTGAAGYQLLRLNASTGGYESVYNGTALSYKNTGLSANTSYTYKVRVYDAKEKYGAYSGATSAKTLKAYTVTFDTNGGSVVAPASKKVSPGLAYGTLPSPVYTGSLFGGWFTAKSGGTAISANTIAALKGNQTLYAHWTLRTFKVTFDAKNGTDTSVRTVRYNSTLGTLPSVTRKNYTFQGWYTTATGGTKITSVTKITAAATYYAHWKGVKSTVTLNANGGKIGSAATKKLSVYYGSAYGTLDPPKRTGYTFKGWFTAASGGTQLTSASKVALTGQAQTLYARWTVNTYTVTFNAAGGTSVSGMRFTYGSKAGTLPGTTRTNYVFQGWYTTASGGTKITPATKITTAVTYYAHWTGVRSTVTLDTNGGKIGLLTKKHIYVYYGSTYGSLDLPVRTGYTFDGWFTAASGGSQVRAASVVFLSSSQTLYAHWTIMSYTVRFDAKNGTAVILRTVSYNNAVGSLPSVTRKNYTFQGWYTAATGGTKITSAVKIKGDVTYYAQWK